MMITIKSFLFICIILGWLSLHCVCDDTPSMKDQNGGDDDSKSVTTVDEKTGAVVNVECNGLSTTEFPDATYLYKTVLAKDGTVELNKNGYFVVEYKTAAVVTKPKENQKTTTHSKLLIGIQKIMSNCKPDDGKISGFYTPEDKNDYRICLTGSEETDDC
ncbi:uncharacterized protein BX664DRAFT_372760 [Halteromyces radiatus]|uniref:uncharacterized protein n=1 Tax=Halteromyces radiatus TaxID=101107 RepID=UPI002220F785|nr:uncharacterized protein BX664DRAFT_372760 [Halteromyces radiatus]KAI8088634.1 hypothetical protein BX664DRAFT_372760 [Halteromyces radiatus]